MTSSINTTTTKIAAFAVVVAVGLALASTTTSSCSQAPDVTDGGYDAVATDAKNDASGDASSADGMVTCDAGATGSDWTGWHRLGGDVACCAIDVPDSPAAAMPPLNWVACTNGAPSCMQMDAPWPLDPLAPYRFGPIHITLDQQSKPKWLWFTRSLLTSTVFEDDLYDLANGDTAIQSWRSDTAPKPWCTLDTRTSSNAVALLALGPSAVSAASGDPTTMANAPSFEQLGGLELLPQSVLTSDSTLAFDLQPEGVIVRNALGSSSIAKTTNTATTLQLTLELVAGSDVFAASTHGTTGYGQEYRVNPDGSYVLFRSNPSAHVSALRTDGSSLFWVETYGSTNVSSPQQSAEVWSAPYTNDPTTLGATAKKLATLSVAQPAVASEAVAFGGLFVARYDAYNAVITRLTDGATLTVQPGANRYFWSLAYVSMTELWATMGEGKQHGAALAKFELASW